HQEYAHLSEIHWRPEKRAYCRFDENGDIEAIVSITTREDKESNISLVSFRWEPLQEYLIATDSSLVRLFDFTLFRSSEFNGWPSKPPQKFYDSEKLFFHQLVIPNTAAYTRGVQVISPRRQNDDVFS